jgi:hypothetical protein
LKLFNDPANKIFLEKLGISKLDYALITNDAAIMSQESENLKDAHIYDAAKMLRFLELGSIIHGENYAANSILITIDEGIQIPLTLYLVDNSVSIVKNPQLKSVQDIKKLAIIIQDNGQGVWDNNDVKWEFEQTKSLFDVSVLYGNGVSDISANSFREILDSSKLKSIKEQNIDFVLVRIHLHDNEETGQLTEIIECLPDNIAKETIYVIQTCYSGKYHKNWNKDAILITSSSANEKSYKTDYKPDELSKYLEGDNASLEGFIKFYANYNGSSTPHMSGIYKGEKITNTPVSEFYKSTIKVTNEDLSIPNSSTNLQPSTTVHCEFETIIEMNKMKILVKAGSTIELFEQPDTITVVEHLGNIDSGIID